MECDGKLGLVPSNHLVIGEAGASGSDAYASLADCESPAPYSQHHHYSSIYETSSTVASSAERNNAIQEFLATEQTYHDFISATIHCMEKYFAPRSSAPLLSPQTEWPLVFLNWHALRDASSELLVHCNRKLTALACHGGIGAALKSELPCLKELYVQFCSRQNSALRLIQSKSNESEQFRNVLKEMQRKEKGMEYGLEAAFIRPMERITRYPLLTKRFVCVWGN